MQTVVLKLIPEIEKNSLTFSSNYRLYSTKEPVIGAEVILNFTDDVTLSGNDSQYLTKKFRYSTDRGNWSLWYNVSDIGSLTFNGDNLFVEVKYEYNNGTKAKLDQPILINEIRFSVSAADEMQNPFTPNINCTEEACPSVITTGTSTFNPYQTDEAVNVFKQLSFNTNLIFGHEVIYFKTEPDRESADYVFKEWTLSKTINRKCIKVLVPGNKFPDNKPTYAEFGIDFELPFEVSIDHQYFQTIFGAGLSPRKKDFLYFPLTNRMYEIQGTYLYRGMMQEPVYWKIQLVKFQPNIDMLMRAEDRTFLDNIITDTVGLFGDKIEADTIDATNPQQFKTISSKFDESRKALHPDLKIKQSNLTYNYSPLIQYYYEANSIPGTVVKATLETGTPTNTSVIFENSDSLTLFAYEESELFHLWLGNKLTTYDLSAGSPIRIRGPYNSHSDLGRYIKIDTFTDSRFKLANRLPWNVDGDGAVSILTRDYAVVYNQTGKLAEDKSNLTYFSLFKVSSVTQSIRFIEAYDNINSLGLRLTGSLSDIQSSTDKNLIVQLELNQTQTLFDQQRIEIDKWYAIFVPVSTQFRQTAMSIYGFTQDPANSTNYNGVVKIGDSAKTLTNSNPIEFTIESNFRLYSSVADISNIRVFDTMVQEEDHDFIISQLFIRDESILRIIDNSRPRLNIPYIGKNR